MRTPESPFELPSWLKFNFDIKGAEDAAKDTDSNSDDDKGDDDDKDDTDSSKGQAKSGKDEDDEDDDDDEDDKESHTAGLKSALAKERKRARDLERENTRLKRQEDRKKTAEQGELATTKEDLSTANKKLEQLAKGYFNSALDKAIEKAARDAKFRDTDDALSLVKRSEIDADQDPDDPTKVDIDLDTVKSAVKDLARRKKHLIQSGTDDDQETGGQFGGKRKRGKDDTSDIEKRYRI